MHRWGKDVKVVLKEMEYESGAGFIWLIRGPSGRMQQTL